mmetsp:Transcript_100514/g.319302  ORF Transcript_100514/g.319302 Transcript_100514/m.319302 type:complete len:203 (-) Transcript_100514:186-794(-)
MPRTPPCVLERGQAVRCRCDKGGRVGRELRCRSSGVQQPRGVLGPVKVPLVQLRVAQERAGDREPRAQPISPVPDVAQDSGEARSGEPHAEAPRVGHVPLQVGAIQPCAVALDPILNRALQLLPPVDVHVVDDEAHEDKQDDQREREGHQGLVSVYAPADPRAHQFPAHSQTCGIAPLHSFVKLLKAFLPVAARDDPVKRLV